MKEEYRAWIDRLTPEEINGKCSERTEEMAAAFPELKRVRGHVFLLFCPEERPHWWLVDEDGEIIDPTVKQFTDSNYIYGGVCKVLHYEPWDESREEPVGKCMDCGAISFYTAYACSESCASSLEDYYGQKVGAFHKTK